MQSFLKDATNLCNNILAYAKTNYSSIEPLSAPLTCNDNFVYDDENRYYLSVANFQVLYSMILKFKESLKLDNLDITKDYQGELRFLHSNLLKSLERILRINKRKTNAKGRKSNYDSYIGLLQKILSLNLNSNATILLNILQHKITEFYASNDANDYLKFRCPETTMCLSFGHDILKAYLLQLTPFYDILNSKNMSLDKSNACDQICRILLNVYHKHMLLEMKSIRKNNKETFVIPKDTLIEIKLLLEVFSGNISEITDDPQVLTLFCKKLLYNVIQKLLRKNLDIGLISLEAYIQENNVFDDMLRAILTRVKEDLTEAEYILGSVIVNYLIENKIFSLQIQEIEGKTIYYVELSTKLTYTLKQNGSDVKPFLCKENKNSLQNSYVNLGDDIVLEFARQDLLNPFRDNNTGYGYFTPLSVFQQHTDLPEIRGTIDKMFLNNFLLDLENYANKTYNSFKEDELQDLYDFLSFYNIDFHKVFQNTPKEHHFYVSQLINVALNFSKLEFDELKDKLIKNLSGDISLREQLLMYLNQIHSYNVVLKAALVDHIIYSCFGYFIMPSFFDFRGRRYFHGISFNIQSYPFLKAFIKLYDINDNTLNDTNFTQVLDSVISEIKDVNIKNTLKAQFSNLSEYKTLVSETIKDYFYEQIDKEKLSREAFNIFFNNLSYKDLRKEVLRIIKKKSKALVFISFLLLEKYKQNSNVCVWYSNIFSYDMTTSGYQMLSLVFKSKSLGSFSNVIVDDSFEETNRDLYLLAANDYKRTIISTFSVYDNFLNNLDKSLSATLSAFLINFYKTTLSVNREELCKTLLLNENLKSIFIREYNTLNKIAWVLFPRDLITIKELRYIDTKVETLKAFKVLLILGRISNYKSVLAENPWIEEHSLLYTRNSRKGIVMISLYGGKEWGRRRSFRKYLKETLLEKSIGLNKNIKAVFSLFPYINSHFSSFKENYLKECNLIVEVGRFLTVFTQEITIQSKYFTCVLCPGKQDTSRRLRQHTKTIELASFRKQYQLSLYRSKLERFNNNYRVAINKKKQISLFCPDYTHFVDAFVVQSYLHIIYNLNSKLQNISPVYQVVGSTIHDNFSLGRFLFPVLPYLLLDIYRSVYDVNPLSFLKCNFKNEEIYLKFLRKFRLSQGQMFPREFISNSNFLKFG